MLFVVEGVGYRTPEVLSIRDMGMGGASVAVPNDVFLLWGNPAGLAAKKRFLESKPRATMVYLLPTQVGVSDRLLRNLFDVTDLLGDNDLFTGSSGDLFGFFERLLDLSDRVPIGFSTVFPFNTSLIGYKWGFSVVGHFKTFFLPMGSIPAVKVRHSMGIDARFGVVPFEASWLSKDDLAVGFGFKVLAYNIFDPVLKLDSLFTGVVGGDNTNSQVLDGLEQSQTTRIGLGLDSGLTFHFAKRFTFGASVLDLLMPTLVLERIELDDLSLFEEVGFHLAFPDVRVGLACQVPSPLFLRNMALSVELHRLFDPLYTAPTRTHMGLSADVVAGRSFVWNVAVGLNKGYLTTSTTIRFPSFFLTPPLQLGYALYRDEWGFAANTFGQTFHIFELALRL